MEAVEALGPSRLHGPQQSTISAQKISGSWAAPPSGSTCCRCARKSRGAKGLRSSSWFGARVSHAKAITGSRRQRKGAIVCEDRRITWDNDEDGWVGGAYLEKGGEDNQSPINSQLIPLLLDMDETHYKFLGLLPTADIEAVRAAFRKLAPVYHPDTSTLPKEVAAEKFVRLREAYEVLSDDTRRRVYDWQLAVQSKPDDGDFIWPYETDRGQWGPNGPGVRPMRPGDFDKDFFDGKNVELSGQSTSALLFDMFAFAAAVGTALYVLYIKNPAPS